VRYRAVEASPNAALQPDALRAWFDHGRPWKSGFMSLMRAIAARDRNRPAPGSADLPSQETYRIGQRPVLAFPPREVASLDTRHGRLDIRLFGLGIWGPQGPLPLHVTELAYHRSVALQDRTLEHFADLFHHRALSLFYRAWAAGQSTAALDRPDEERFSFYVASLMGTDQDEARQSCLPTHARYGASAHIVREARNPEGIAATLSQYFDVPIAVEEYVPHWIRVDASGHCRLGLPGASSFMGEAAMLGEQIADRQHKFRLVIGPLDFLHYQRLAPRGEDLRTLVEWVRAFIGYEYDWEIQLLIKPEEVPAPHVDGRQRLGHSIWLGECDPAQPVSGMVFEPEAYAA